MSVMALLVDLMVKSSEFAVQQTKLFVANNAKAVLTPREFDAYMGGLSFDLNDQYELSIRTTTPEAEKLENGSASFDMKPALLASATAQRNKAKSAKGEPYLNVPFRMHGPNASGNSKYGQKVEEYVAGVMGAIRGNNTRDRFRSGKGDFAGIDRTPYSSRVSNIYEDILMHGDYQRAQDPATFPTAFATIRRVSKSSPMDTWIYPARQGVLLIPRAEDLYRQILSAVGSTLPES